MSNQINYIPVVPIGLVLPGLKDGVALGLHTTESTMVDGNRFSSQYTPMGQIVHNLKYGKKTPSGRKIFLSPDEATSLIETELKPLIANALTNMPLPSSLVVLPIPSHFGNLWQKERKYQYQIAQTVADLLGVRKYENLKKVTNFRAKTMDEKAAFKPGDFSLSPSFLYPTNILLVDDVYGTGATAAACIELLQADENVKNIYLLTITKIRTSGLKSN